MDDTRKKLIEATFETVYRHGYWGTSVGMILEKTGLTKGALYHYFKSKKELVLAMADEVFGTFIRQYWEEPFTNSTDPLRDLTDRIRRLPEATLGDCSERILDFQYGCPLNNLIQEMLPVDEDFAQVLRGYMIRWQKSVQGLLEKARDRGDLKAGLDLEEVALFLTTTVEACIMAGKLIASQSDYFRCSRQIEQYIATIRK